MTEDKGPTRLPLVLAALALFVAACSPGNVWSLEVGDCFDDWDGATSSVESQEITDVPIVDCGEPHDNEIYMKSDLADGTYPGDAAMEEIVVDTCYEGFEEFVGVPYEDSVLDFGWLFPTSESWADGDREVICFVFDYEYEKLEGSMDSARV